MGFLHIAGMSTYSMRERIMRKNSRLLLLLLEGGFDSTEGKDLNFAGRKDYDSN